MAGRLSVEARAELERRCEALRLELRLVEAELRADEALRLGVCESGGGLLRQVRRAAASVQRWRWAPMAMGGCDVILGTMKGFGSRAILTPRGGQWHATSVVRLMERLAT
jgi:hypothetical protein